MELDEDRRLAALRRLDILDTAAESDYDDITALAAAICGTPIAAITLVDAERQWFKSQIGLGVSETSREDSFCAHAIQTPQDLFIVPDATADPRFVDNALVTGDPSIRFYAGAPLVMGDGTPLGSLCVIDRRPRQLTAEQYAALGTLARQVSRLIQHRVATRRVLEATRNQLAAEASRQVAADRFERVFALSASGMLAIGRHGSVTEANAAFAAQLGMAVGDLPGRSIVDLTAPRDRLADADLARDLLAGTRQLVRREKHFLAADGTAVPALVTSCLIPVTAAGGVEFLDQVEWLTEQRRAEDRLLETQSAVDAIVSVDAAGRVISWNDGATRMFGWERDQMLGHDLAAIIPARMFGAHESGMARLAAGGPPVLIGTTIDLRACRRNGDEFPVQLSLSAWERGGHHYRTAILRDDTAAKRTAQLMGVVGQAATVANDCAELDEALARLVAVLGPAGPADTVQGWVGQLDGHPVARWNSSGQPADAIAATGAADELAPVSVITLPGGRTRLRVPILLDRWVCGMLQLDGPAALGGDTALHETLAVVGGQLARVAERARTSSELVTRSMTDPLTGLPNRRRTLELLRAELDEAPPRPSAAVLFLDLDRFKTVNDSLGHAAGDQVLRSVAARLSGLLRAGDTLARQGGDEFLILCTGLPDGLLVESVARRLLGALAEPFSVGDTQVYLGASIGIVTVTRSAAVDSAATAETLLRYADIAMYRAKAAGGGYAVFDDSMGQEVQQRLDAHGALHQALPRKELVVHYQPVVAPADGHVAGFEALVRWERPGHGLLPPSDFIPLAEETGLVVPLGRYVLHEACRQLVEWRTGHPDLTDTYVAVNVAAAQLERDLVTTVADILTETGLPADRLILEITEGALLRDLRQTTELLNALRRLGIRVAVDDFGTGYSSLSYLSQLPVDVLKIDRSFITALGTAPTAGALIDVVLGLAGVLKLSVVAEGVETAQQATDLRNRGCDAIQGYYYSRPVRAADVPQVFDHLSCLSTRTA